MAIPVVRDQLIPFLEQGRGDIAAASLTITPERQQIVDFSVPAASNVSELVVTGPGSPAVATLDDLAGQKVFVRPSSSYQGSLEKLNESFRQRGLDEIIIAPVSEYLETEDLLEMVNAGLIGITIADSYLAEFWAQVLPDIVVRSDVAVGTGQKIAWAIRRDATGLKPHVDRFVAANDKGSLLFNTLMKRYLENTKFVKNALAEEERTKAPDRRCFASTAVNTASTLSWSPLRPTRSPGSIRASSAGPAPSVSCRSCRRQPPTNRSASRMSRPSKITSTPGPSTSAISSTIISTTRPSTTSIARCLLSPRTTRGRTASSVFGQGRRGGYDPNVWFLNVEVVVADEVGREPVQYVRNIFKYYTAYSLLSEQDEIRHELKTGKTVED